MAVSETAQRNHDELFPGHVSTLKATDPELIEVFGNFAFDEVLQHCSLDIRTRLVVQLAALIGCQAISEYRVMLGTPPTTSCPIAASGCRSTGRPRPPPAPGMRRPTSTSAMTGRR